MQLSKNSATNILEKLNHLARFPEAVFFDVQCIRSDKHIVCNYLLGRKVVLCRCICTTIILPLEHTKFEFVKLILLNCLKVKFYIINYKIHLKRKTQN